MYILGAEWRQLISERFNVLLHFVVERTLFSHQKATSSVGKIGAQFHQPLQSNKHLLLQHDAKNVGDISWGFSFISPL
jgi:hypothetical protein